jgi:hypothetical protein
MAASSFSPEDPFRQSQPLVLQLDHQAFVLIEVCAELRSRV